VARVVTSLETRRVYLRPVQASDRAAFLEMAQSSRTFHEPWISPPLTPRAFDQYLSRTRRDDHEGLLVCIAATEHIAGVININNIIRGSFLSASLGYYASAAHAGAGYMTEGLKLTTQLAFDGLGLHRLEANIQPTNLPSINLVKRCGFKREGLSPQYLFIDGAWRDHERWAIFSPRDTLVSPASPVVSR
jgi:ribosomal-protein-alanine N-acetyltransferase